MENQEAELDFDGCLKIEVAGMKALGEDIEKVFPGGISNIEVIKGKFEQRYFGDFYMSKPEWGGRRNVELKTDNTEWRLAKYSNIFLETWSDFQVNPGWMVTSNTDCLIYQFLKVRRYYVINFKRLKRYFEENKDKLVESEQHRVKQENVAKGLLWPISDAERNKDFVRVVQLMTDAQELEVAVNDIHKRRGDNKKKS